MICSQGGLLQKNTSVYSDVMKAKIVSIAAESLDNDEIP